MLTRRFLTTLLLLTLSLVHPMIQDYKTVFLRQQSLTEQIYLVAAGDIVWNDFVMLGETALRNLLTVFLVS